MKIETIASAKLESGPAATTGIESFSCMFVSIAAEPVNKSILIPETIQPNLSAT